MCHCIKSMFRVLGVYNFGTRVKKLPAPHSHNGNCKYVWAVILSKLSSFQWHFKTEHAETQICTCYVFCRYISPSVQRSIHSCLNYCWKLRFAFNVLHHLTLFNIQAVFFTKETANLVLGSIRYIFLFTEFLRLYS